MLFLEGLTMLHLIRLRVSELKPHCASINCPAQLMAFGWLLINPWMVSRMRTKDVANLL